MKKILNALEELKNPYVKTYSVKEAIKKGLEIDSEFVDSKLINMRENNTVFYWSRNTNSNPNKIAIFNIFVNFTNYLI